MGFKSGPVTLGTTDTTIFECPATFEGACVLGIANIGSASRAYTLKFYKASTAQTTVIANAVSIAVNTTVKFPTPLSLEPGDIVSGLCAASATDIVVTPTITLGASTAAKGLTPRGEYSSIVTYAKNDLVSVSGVGSFISIVDNNVDNDPTLSPSAWMVNAPKGDAGAAGASGTAGLTVVRVVSTGSTSPSGGGFAAGATIDGVTLAQNDLVLRASATNPELNGVYIAPASGAASRHVNFATYDSHPGVVFSVIDGTANGDTLWSCTSSKGGTIDVTALSIGSRADRAETLTNKTLGTGVVASTQSPGDASAKVATCAYADRIALRGHINGLTLSNDPNFDSNKNVVVAAGECASDDINPVLMKLTSPIIKQLDQAWVVGSTTGASAPNIKGGLDAGTVADGTYHVFLIQRSDTGVVDVLLSTSASSPTMPANYDRKRYIHSILRESGTIIPFVQYDDTILRSSTFSYNNTASRSLSLLALNVPSGISVIPLLNSKFQMAASAGNVIVSVAPGTNNSITWDICAVNVTSDRSYIPIDGPPTNTSRQIYFGVNIQSGSLTNGILETRGWRVNRRSI